MDMSTAIVAIIIGAILLVLAVGASALITRAKTSVPVEEPQTGAADGLISVPAVLNALEKWAYQAILAGEKIVQEVMTTTQIRLEGEDKAAVANRVYDLLPAMVTIPVAGKALTINPKDLVNREQFAEFIKRLYGEGAAFVSKNKAWLRKAVDDVIPGDDMVAAGYKPPVPPIGGSEAKDVDHPVAGKG